MRWRKGFGVALFPPSISVLGKCFVSLIFWELGDVDRSFNPLGEFSLETSLTGAVCRFEVAFWASFFISPLRRSFSSLIGFVEEGQRCTNPRTNNGLRGYKLECSRFGYGQVCFLQSRG